jgi:hypothetical protein
MFHFPNSNLKVIFVDCVGFVSELPTQLVASFRYKIKIINKKIKIKIKIQIDFKKSGGF